MEQARKNQRGSWIRSRAKREVIQEAEKRQRKSPLCYIDGQMPSQEFGVRTKISEVQRSCRAPRWHCKRRLWSLCSFYWTGLICISNDCSKSNGCHRQATRLWWTSSWRSISVHSGKNGGCSQIAQNSKIRISWNMDTSSTTQMAEVVDEHWRPSSTTWRKLVRTSVCWSLMGETVWRNSITSWMGKVHRWECLFVHRKQRLFLSVYVDDIKMAGKKQNMSSMWKKLMKNVDLDEPTSFPDHVNLGCT